MQPSKLLKQEAFCLRTYFGVKSAKQSENSSKGPCEGAKENISPHQNESFTFEGHSERRKQLLQIQQKKKRIRFATSQGNMEFLLSGEKSSGLISRESPDISQEVKKFSKVDNDKQSDKIKSTT